MKNDFKISRLAIICVLCTAVSGAYGASSVRALGGSDTYSSASSAAAANSNASNSSSSVRGGSLRVTPSSGVSGTSTTVSAGNTTSGRVATTPRLSIGQYLGGTTSVSGGSSLRPQTPSTGGSSSGDGSFDQELASELTSRVDQLQRDVDDLRVANDNVSDQLLDKQDILIPAQDGYIIIDDNTNEIFVDVDALQESLDTIAGQDGREVELGYNETDLLWRYSGENDSQWRILISKAEITGPQGPQGEKGEKGDSADMSLYSTTEQMNAAIQSAISGLADVYLTKEAADATYANKELTERGLQTRELATNKATAITAENQASNTAYPSVGAVVQWTDQKITDLTNTGLPVNPDKINDGAIPGTKLTDGTVTESKLSSELVSEIAGKEDAINKVQTITNSATEYPSTAAVYTALETKADTVDVDAVAEDVALLDAALNTPDTGLAAQIASAVSKADSAQSAADEAVAGLATKQDKLTYTPEDVSRKVTLIDVGNEKSVDAYPSVKAVVDWTNEQILSLSEEGVPVNPNNFQDNSIEGVKLKDGTVTADKLSNEVITIIDNKVNADELGALAYVSQVGTNEIEDDSVTDAKLSSEVQNKINSALTTAGAAKNQILGTDANGDPVWYDIEL